MHALTTVVLLIAALLVPPTPAFCQPALAGLVRDSSGAVLPGVNVEAASPALIEKSRTVVTDGTGQYRIVDLEPGTYTVTFTLSGFATIRREAHRAHRRRRDDDQCRPASRRGRPRRSPSPERRPSSIRRRARNARSCSPTRCSPRSRRLANLRQHPGHGARSPVVDARRELHPVDDRDRHEFLLHVARRPRQRRHGADRRHERRVGVRRRRRFELRLRFRQRAGGPGDRRRRHGRARPWRPGVQHHSQDRRQHVQRQRVRQHGRQVVTGQQPRRSSCAAPASPSRPD